MTIQLESVGIVRSPRVEAVDDNWGKVISTIEMDSARFSADALQGLDTFSHLEVIYFFHLVGEAKIETAARHPRNRTDWPQIGIFSQRGKNRPNRIGVSVCRFLKVDGLTITVEGLDAIEGTPVLDVKPYIKEFGPREAVVQPDWATELMDAYYRD